MPIRIAIDNSVGTELANFLLVSDLVAATAITKAVDEGADVINCSWGGPSVISDVERNAIDYAHRQGRGGKGAIVIASAGNGSISQSSCTTASVLAPANYTPVIAIGATNKNDKITCYSYSNYYYTYCKKSWDMFVPDSVFHGIIPPSGVAVGVGLSIVGDGDAGGLGVRVGLSSGIVGDGVILGTELSNRYSGEICALSLSFLITGSSNVAFIGKASFSKDSGVVDLTRL